MRTLFTPGVAILTRLMNRRKIPLVSACYLLPFLVAVIPSLDALAPGHWVVLAAVLAIVAYFAVSFYVQSALGFKACWHMIKRLGEGDLSARPDLSIRGSLGAMIRGLAQVNVNLGRIVSQVRSSAESISLTAREIRAGQVNLSERTEQQASALEETAAGMEELAATVKQNADHSQAAGALSADATAVAERGAQTVHRAVERMNLIDGSSHKIVDIIGVIDAIAFQTNILALNAAVEAARAGDQGRGFAVVAAEVRNLAQRSAQAAKEIKALIQDSVGNIREGGKLVAEAGVIINDIVTGVRNADALFGQVASASQEQSRGVAQINGAVAQLEGMTQQNAALVEQTTAAMGAFEQETQLLVQTVQRFHVPQAFDAGDDAGHSRRAGEGLGLLTPGVRLMTRMPLHQKYPLLLALHLLPFAVLAWAARETWSPVVMGCAGAALLVAFYAMACYILQVKRDFPVLEGAIRRISEGDLRQRRDIRVGGDIGQMISELAQVNVNLGRIVSQVRSSAESISLTAREIRAGQVNLSERTEQQASALEETAAGMEELAATVKQNADHSQAAGALSADATAVAERGAQTVHRAVERMNLIDGSSHKIVDIIGVIDAIAFQTNILALNAAVEAARAGDQGRGFAVVAAEVRNLAQRSAQAAKEIKALIQDSVGNIREGGKLVAEAGVIINDIVTGVRNADALFGQVASASQEQSRGVAQINGAVAQLEGMTQQNAALVEQTTAAMTAFEQETQRLLQMVQRFSLPGDAAGDRAGIQADTPADAVARLPAAPPAAFTPRLERPAHRRRA